MSEYNERISRIEEILKTSMEERRVSDYAAMEASLHNEIILGVIVSIFLSVFCNCLLKLYFPETRGYRN